MGLLDDAIREHLELKRRRGADPSEIERSEREALGPVRRAPEELEPADFDLHNGADQADEYEAEYEYEEVGEHEEVGEDEAPYPEGEEGLAPPESDLYDAEPPEYEPPGHDPLPDADEPEPHSAEPPVYHEPPQEDEPFAEAPPAYETPSPVQEPEPPADEPQQLAHEAPPPETDEPGQETVEYELDDHPDAEHGEHREGEDVLEETPEFLQDTPEHDRLWFEQRPPRDFDFDG